MSLYESFDFSERVIMVAKIAFVLERIYELRFLTEFFPAVFFSYAKEENTGKKSCRYSVNENSSKVWRNTSPQKRWKNYAKR